MAGGRHGPQAKTSKAALQAQWREEIARLLNQLA
jgi:hypothetical protein